MPSTTTTPTQRKREQEKLEDDTFLRTCTSHQLLAHISDKWATLILAALGGSGPAPRGSAPGDPVRCATPSCRPAGRGEPEDAHADAPLARPRRPDQPPSRPPCRSRSTTS